MPVNLFKNIPLFEHLPEPDLELLVEHATLRTFTRNTILIHEGDTTNSLYVVESGRVKIYLNDSEGHEVILGMEGPGSYIGEIALLDDEPRSASAMTLEPTTCYVITRDDFRQLLSANPEFALNVIRNLTQRLRSVTEKVRNLALRNVYGRVVSTIQQLADDHDGKRVVREKLTQQELADMVGASREMVSRILGDLTTGGYIQIENRQITILKNPPAGW